VFAVRSFRRGEFIFRRRHVGSYGCQLGSLSREHRRTCASSTTTEAPSLRGVLSEPLLRTQRDAKCVKVFAWRRIAAGEEITIDYR